MTMPERLRMYRRRADRMTQKELAELVDLSIGVVRDAEREPAERRRRVTDKSFAKIVKATGVGPVSAWFEEVATDQELGAR